MWVQTLVPETDTRTIDNTEPLYYAASFGLVPVVKAILASDPNVNINARGGRFNSPSLFVACWRRNYEVAEILLKAGADPRAPDFSTGDWHTVFTVFDTMEKLGRVARLPEKEALRRLRSVAEEATSKR